MVGAFWPAGREDEMKFEEHFTQCKNCEIMFSWAPIENNGSLFCCAGCAAGGPCVCSYDLGPYYWRIDDDFWPKQKRITPHEPR